ncbi:MAG: ClpXP protease specificity-enhancing factor [Betaproteobacteria bacterium]|jgi:stringent starvation protein B
MRSDSTTPYLIRAIYEWCVDNGLTPYLAVRASEHTRVPLEHVRNGEIILNVSGDATRNLTLGNELIQFSARFNGVSHEISVPIDSVRGIFAKENGQGLAFQEPVPEEQRPSSDAEVTPPRGDGPPSPGAGRPRLQVIK